MRLEMFSWRQGNNKGLVWRGGLHVLLSQKLTILDTSDAPIYSINTMRAGILKLANTNI